VLAQREGDVFEYRHVGEQGAELEQHAHAPAQGVEARGIELVDRMPAHAHRAARGLELPADDAQQRRLAAARGAHDRDDLAARDPHRDSLEDRACVVGEAHRLDVDQYVFGHAGKMQAKGATF